MSKKLFVGYDLGDGETSISILSPNDADPRAIRMPNTIDKGEPITTAYGRCRNGGSAILGKDLLGENILTKYDVYANFKQKPSEAIKQLPQTWRDKLLTASQKGDINRLCRLFKKAEREVNGATFMPTCVREFTDAIFSHPYVIESLESYADQCEEAAIFIGHPTKWDEVDACLYEAMLRCSILGKGFLEGKKVSIKVGIHFEKESRAAFLNGKRKYKSESEWEVGKYTLVVDVGSSTTDVTAVYGLDVDSMHDDGDPKLGARLIDEAIYEYYRNRLEALGQLHVLDDSLQGEFMGKTLCVLACRVAKEEFFSMEKYTPRIRIPGDLAKYGLMDIPVPRADMDRVLATPIKALDNQSWNSYLESFLKKQKNKLDKFGKKVDRIILTGGAARMDFVKESCRKVFGEEATTYYDDNPGMAICMGLALVGESNERSLEFQKEAQKWIKKELPALIRKRIPLLSSKLSELVVEVVLDDIAFTELKHWRSGDHRTLDDTIASIKAKCSEQELGSKLASNARYVRILKHWVTSDIIGSINNDILNLCKKFGLTTMKASSVDIKNVKVDMENSLNKAGLGTNIGAEIVKVGDTVAGVVALVTMLVTYIILPIILIVLIKIIAVISTTLAALIVTILGAIPGPGWFILSVITAVAVGKIVLNGWESVKKEAIEKVMSYNLPAWVRNRISMERLKASLNEKRPEMKETIEHELQSSKTARQLSEKVAASLTPQIETKLKEIRYIIESK